MRQAFIILALALTILLHVFTWEKTSAARSSQSRIPGEQSEAVSILADISPSMQGDRITVVGRISDMWEPAGKRAPHTIILRDGSAALEVVHWLKLPLSAAIGDSVECKGSVDLYRGGLQLRLWNPEDLKVLRSRKKIRSGEPASSGQ